jgi:hypothetical protein
MDKQPHEIVNTFSDPQAELPEERNVDLNVGDEVQYVGIKTQYTGWVGQIGDRAGRPTTRMAPVGTFWVDWYHDIEVAGAACPPAGWYDAESLEPNPQPIYALPRVYPGELIAKWRGEADPKLRTDPDDETGKLLAKVLNRCADELEAALNAMDETNRRAELAQMSNAELIRLAEMPVTPEAAVAVEGGQQALAQFTDDQLRTYRQAIELRDRGWD